MIYTLSASLLASGLFFGMLIFFELGRRIGKSRLVHQPEGLAKGGGTVEAGIFGLLGLLIAFTFSGGASRFESRRNLVTEEANAIGTAYLRIDLLPAAVQPAMRQSFREYLDARLESYRKLPDIEAAKAELDPNGGFCSHVVTRRVCDHRHRISTPWPDSR